MHTAEPDITPFIPHIIDPFQNQVPTLPTVQLS